MSRRGSSGRRSAEGRRSGDGPTPTWGASPTPDSATHWDDNHQTYLSDTLMHAEKEKDILRTVPEHLYQKRPYETPWNEDMSRYLRKGQKGSKPKKTTETPIKKPYVSAGGKSGIPALKDLPPISASKMTRRKRVLPTAPKNVDKNVDPKTPKSKKESVFSRLSDPKRFPNNYRIKIITKKPDIDTKPLGFGSSSISPLRQAKSSQPTLKSPPSRTSKPTPTRNGHLAPPSEHCTPGGRPVQPQLGVTPAASSAIKPNTKRKPTPATSVTTANNDNTTTTDNTKNIFGRPRRETVFDRLSNPKNYTGHVRAKYIERISRAERQLPQAPPQHDYQPPPHHPPPHQRQLPQQPQPPQPQQRPPKQTPPKQTPVATWQSSARAVERPSRAGNVRPSNGAAQSVRRLPSRPKYDTGVRPAWEKNKPKTTKIPELDEIKPVAPPLRKKLPVAPVVHQTTEESYLSNFSDDKDFEKPKFKFNLSKSSPHEDPVETKSDDDEPASPKTHDERLKRRLDEAKEDEGDASMIGVDHHVDSPSTSPTSTPQQRMATPPKSEAEMRKLKFAEQMRQREATRLKREQLALHEANRRQEQDRLRKERLHLVEQKRLDRVQEKAQARQLQEQKVSKRAQERMESKQSAYNERERDLAQLEHEHRVIADRELRRLHNRDGDDDGNGEPVGGGGFLQDIARALQNADKVVTPEDDERSIPDESPPLTPPQRQHLEQPTQQQQLPVVSPHQSDAFPERPSSSPPDNEGNDASHFPMTTTTTTTPLPLTSTKETGDERLAREQLEQEEAERLEDEELERLEDEEKLEHLERVATQEALDVPTKDSPSPSPPPQQHQQHQQQHQHDNTVSSTDVFKQELDQHLGSEVVALSQTDELAAERAMLEKALYPDGQPQTNDDNSNNNTSNNSNTNNTNTSNNNNTNNTNNNTHTATDSNNGDVLVPVSPALAKTIGMEPTSTVITKPNVDVPTMTGVDSDPILSRPQSLVVVDEPEGRALSPAMQARAKRELKKREKELALQREKEKDASTITSEPTPTPTTTTSLSPPQQQQQQQQTQPDKNGAHTVSSGVQARIQALKLQNEGPTNSPVEPAKHPEEKFESRSTGLDGILARRAQAHADRMVNDADNKPPPTTTTSPPTPPTTTTTTATAVTFDPHTVQESLTSFTSTNIPKDAFNDTHRELAMSPPNNEWSESPQIEWSRGLSEGSRNLVHQATEKPPTPPTTAPPPKEVAEDKVITIPPPPSSSSLTTVDDDEREDAPPPPPLPLSPPPFDDDDIEMDFTVVPPPPPSTQQPHVEPTPGPGVGVLARVSSIDDFEEPLAGVPPPPPLSRPTSEYELPVQLRHPKPAADEKRLSAKEIARAKREQRRAAKSKTNSSFVVPTTTIPDSPSPTLSMMSIGEPDFTNNFAPHLSTSSMGSIASIGRFSNMSHDGGSSEPGAPRWLVNGQQDSIVKLEVRKTSALEHVFGLTLGQVPPGTPGPAVFVQAVELGKGGGTGGVQPNDRLLEVNDEDVRKLTPQQVYTKLTNIMPRVVVPLLVARSSAQAWRSPSAASSSTNPSSTNTNTNVTPPLMSPDRGFEETNFNFTKSLGSSMVSRPFSHISDLAATLTAMNTKLPGAFRFVLRDNGSGIFDGFVKIFLHIDGEEGYKILRVDSTHTAAHVLQQIMKVVPALRRGGRQYQLCELDSSAPTRISVLSSDKSPLRLMLNWSVDKLRVAFDDKIDNNPTEGFLIRVSSE